MLPTLRNGNARRSSARIQTQNSPKHDTDDLTPQDADESEAIEHAIELEAEAEINAQSWEIAQEIAELTDDIEGSRPSRSVLVETPLMRFWRRSRRAVRS